ncbi:hypothetical protein S1OALGB6SA_872 [Olavius algarvensis spirochete endosymbiont]|uniref:hypothetical protein n=1 Tax=Olavius algarvensis spirochete endosymbiont TaxID=260710 RepID=UPI000F0DF795|nr:hypothetical protein [Olavius algarvensis spirochete endosymbiont]VDA99799.1 hypothetical protein S1OALGB6SA_872 [Olavius algarvensis spirochete endosymbiont]
MKAAALADGIYEIHTETWPRMSRKEVYSAMMQKLPVLVPGNPKSYAIDVKTKKIAPNSHRSVCIIVKKDALASFRKAHPDSAMRIRETDYLWNQNKPCQYPFFAPPRFHSRYKVQIISSSILLFAMSLFLLGQLYKYLAQKRLTELSETYGNLTELLRGKTELIDEIHSMEKRLLYLKRNSPDNPYNLIEELAASTPERIHSEAVVIRGRFFSIRGLTENPFSVIQILEKHPYFEECRLERTVPDSRSGLTAFTLTGIYNAP